MIRALCFVLRIGGRSKLKREEIFCLNPVLDESIVSELEKLSRQQLYGAEGIALKQFKFSIIAVLIC